MGARQKAGKPRQNPAWSCATDLPVSSSHLFLMLRLGWIFVVQRQIQLQNIDTRLAQEPELP